MDPLFPDLGSSALLHSAQVRNHNVLGKLKWPGWHTTQHHVVPVGCEGWGGSSISINQPVGKGHL